MNGGIPPSSPPGLHHHLRRHAHRQDSRSRDRDLLDLLPTSRSAVGYWHNDTSYVVRPDISFILDLAQGYRHCFME